MLTLLLLSCQQKADTPEAIVKKVIAAHGGAEKLRAVNGYLYLGQIQAAMADDQGKVWILYREPEQLRVIIRMTEGKEERLLLGDEGWRDNGRGFVKVDGPALAVMAFQAEHIDLPRHLVEKRYKVKKAEIQNEEKGETLILTDADGVETVVVVDPVRSVIRTVEREFDIAGQTVRMGSPTKTTVMSRGCSCRSGCSTSLTDSWSAGPTTSRYRSTRRYRNGSSSDRSNV